MTAPTASFEENSKFLHREFAESSADQTAALPLSALNHLNRAVAVIGTGRTVLYKNRAFDELFGGHEWPAGLREFLEPIAQGIDPTGSRETAFEDGRTFHIETVNLPEGLLLTAEDISKVVAELARSAEQARTDPLTLLGNRLMFRERLRELIANLDHAKETAAVLSIDLDRFKAINDALGHTRSAMRC